jgi:hypothetical protein
MPVAIGSSRNTSEVRRRVFLTLLLAAGCFPVLTLAAAVPVGGVIASQGQCFSVSAGQRVPLKTGAAVGIGDVVEVPAGAKLKLRMNDGSIISAASGSEIGIEDYTVDASGQRLKAVLSLHSGLLRALVTAGAPGTFEVETSVGVAVVRSADWFISAAPDAAQVGVLSGTVTLASRATDRSVAIPPRWGGRLEAGRDPVPPRLWSREEFDDFIARTNVE